MHLAMEIAIEKFLLGKFRDCKTLLERNSDLKESERTTSLAVAGQWLTENNLIVCEYKEQLVLGTPDNSEMIDSLGRLADMMQGLPPSLGNLCLEMTVAFNLSALILQRMTSRRREQAGSDRVRLAADSVPTGLSRLMETVKVTLQRVINAMGVATHRKSVQQLLSTLADLSHLVPMSIVSLVILLCCVLSLAHMATNQHQLALDVLHSAVMIQSNGIEDEEHEESRALIIDLNISSPAVQIPCSYGQSRHSVDFDVGDFIHSLETFCLYQMGQWNDCLLHIRRKDVIVPDSLMLTTKFIQGYCLYQNRSYKKALIPLTELDQRTDCDTSLHVKYLNLMGCCYCLLRKPKNAVKIFLRSLKLDPGFLVPLLNISFAYQHLDITGSQIESLRLFLKTLKEKESQVGFIPGRCDLIPGPPPLSSSNPHQDGCPSYVLDERLLSRHTVEYRLALRYLQLGRHSQAARTYQELLDEITGMSPGEKIVPRRGSAGFPHLEVVYLQAAFSSYSSGEYIKSLSIAERILAKIAPRISSIKASCTDAAKDSHVGHEPSHRFDGTGFVGPTPEGKPGCGRGAVEDRLSGEIAYRHSYVTTRSILLSGEDWTVGDSHQRRLLIATMLLLKVNCHMKNRSPLPLDATEDILKYLAGCPDDYQDDEARLGGVVDGPIEKRMKIESILVLNENGTHRPITDADLREIKAKAYNNKAVILIGRNRCLEALEMLINSVKCKSDDADALFNHTLLLAALGRLQEAAKMLKRLLIVETSQETTKLSQLLALQSLSGD